MKFDASTQKRLSHVLIFIGVVAWFPYGIGKYLLGYDLEPTWFLTAHLIGVIPGGILKRWKRK